jgi:hypothetical protein
MIMILSQIMSKEQTQLNIIKQATLELSRIYGEPVKVISSSNAKVESSKILEMTRCNL